MTRLCTYLVRIVEYHSHEMMEKLGYYHFLSCQCSSPCWIGEVILSLETSEEEDCCQSFLHQSWSFSVILSVMCNQVEHSVDISWIILTVILNISKMAITIHPELTGFAGDNPVGQDPGSTASIVEDILNKTLILMMRCQRLCLTPGGAEPGHWTAGTWQHVVVRKTSQTIVTVTDNKLSIWVKILNVKSTTIKQVNK